MNSTQIKILKEENRRLREAIDIVKQGGYMVEDVDLSGGEEID